MSVFQAISLGSAAPAGAPALKAGYEWFPYVDTKGAQLKTCPSAATQAGRGCYMIGGKAYGQRVINENEFGSTPLTVRQPPATSTPKVNYDCNKAFLSWLSANPQLATCGQTTQHKSTYNLLCTQIRNGNITAAQGEITWRQYIAKECPSSAPPPPPKMTAPPPSNVKQPPVPPPAAPPPGRVVNPPPEPPVLDEPGDQPPPVTQHASVLQQIGPIVGIGLLAAIGLTMARKMKKGRLTKRRHRR